MLAGVSTVVMEYPPEGALPRVSRVDAGTVELVRSPGVEVITSADLMQFATQRWTREQLENHRHSADILGRIVNDSFRFIGEHLKEQVTEFRVAEFIRRRFDDEGMSSPDGPIVATTTHTSDPHYELESEDSSVIRQGDWVLIDLWAKPDAEGNVYADITWVAYVSKSVTER